ncbi:sarcosine oxidase subunit gamma [Pseudohoeflea sp. DP4N28-3]|uniref:Sarcosine oxidase subunit gamma n=2 Tax=Pseudohoeflea coraliihabitans TaxID=2860393 RepID=A0ABS6WKF5_9HYPH|nr:sarcosine oxidase subunit gamma [Pseudohoeflea sp. DP4N28-3]
MTPAPRDGVINEHRFAIPGLDITPLPPAFRVSLRAGPDDVGALSQALDVGLPVAPKSSAIGKSGRQALWLGPDEWLIIDAEADPMIDLEKAKAVHSAVDISHRNVALAISGRRARATLEAGCPQDLAERAFPVAACSRTVLGKIEVVLLREGPERFRLECWRSFADYAWTFLSEAALAARP